MLIYFGIGSNLGDREKNLLTALQLLRERVGECRACSSIYYSDPQGFVSDNEFVNIVAVFETSFLPEELLTITQQIEREMGRTIKSANGIYHDRIIDIDLLKATQNSEIIIQNSPTLTLPHPRMHEREFVLIPLQEVEQILFKLL
jgi:2-amino-4-hydroxy-6-hydroxymethyldihydropteridine diphosphokinase